MSTTFGGAGSHTAIPHHGSGWNWSALIAGLVLVAAAIGLGAWFLGQQEESATEPVSAAVESVAPVDLSNDPILRNLMARDYISSPATTPASVLAKDEIIDKLIASGYISPQTATSASTLAKDEIIDKLMARGYISSQTATSASTLAKDEIIDKLMARGSASTPVAPMTSESVAIIEDLVARGYLPPGALPVQD